MTQDTRDTVTVPPGADPDRSAPLADVVRPDRRALAISAAVSLVAALVLLAVLPSPHADVEKTINPAGVIAKAQAVAPAVVHAPAPLPAGWRPDSAHLSVGKKGTHLHLGYFGPDNGYNGVEETDYGAGRNTRVFVAQISADGKVVDLVTIDGLVWAHLVSTRKSIQQSLVEYAPTVTTIVTGTSSFELLEQLAASLRLPHASS